MAEAPNANVKTMARSHLAGALKALRTRVSVALERAAHAAAHPDVCCCGAVRPLDDGCAAETLTELEELEGTAVARTVKSCGGRVSFVSEIDTWKRTRCDHTVDAAMCIMGVSTSRRRRWTGRTYEMP